MAALPRTDLEGYGEGKIKPQAMAVLMPQASPKPGLGSTWLKMGLRVLGAIIL